MKGFFHSSTVQQSAPDGLVPKCGACGLYKNCKSPKMQPHGLGRKRVLVVGEAPGEQEDEEGRPFIGKSGQHLRQTLAALGVKLDRDATVTNALVCRPPNNATPDIDQISYCRPNLLNTIKEFQPEVIVTLGRSALVSVVHGHWKGDVGPMERWVGWKIPLENFWLCPTYHPSFLLRMKNILMDRQFSDHLEQAFTIEDPTPAVFDPTKAVDVIFDTSSVDGLLREIDSIGGWAAVDYETTGLKPEYPKARIVSCAVSNGLRTIAYPWTDETANATSRFLRSKRTRKISSNLKMEERWTRCKLGHRVVNWGWDTVVAAHCLDNRPEICSLKFQSFVKMGVTTYNENVEPYLKGNKGHYNRIKEIQIRTLLIYNGVDALLEHRLAMIQRKEMGYGDDTK